MHSRVTKRVSISKWKLLGFDQSIGWFALQCALRVWEGDDASTALVEVE